MSEVIMYCVFAMESVKKMNGNRGKLASMAGHAYLHAAWDSEARHVYMWGADTEWSSSYPRGDYLDYKRSGMAKKVTLRVETVEELKALEESYRKICGVSLVTDAGLTVFEEPTTVCLGIGPIRKSQVKEDLSSLKVLI